MEMRRRVSGLRLTVLIVVVLSAGCRRAVVSGTVVDVFQKPLAGAAVTVEGTSFSTMTDSDGKYSLRFVPGQFKVVIKREGYTTITTPYNVAESTNLPAAEIVLYPRPSDTGIFYIGKEHLEPLAAARLRREQVPNPIQWLPGSTRYLFQKGLTLVLPEGDAQFIDTLPRPVQLARATSRSGLFLDSGRNEAPGVVKAVAEKIGDEQLTVWKVHLKPGVYGWIEVGENVLGGKVPGESYFGFQVGDAPWFSFIGTFSSTSNFDPNALQQEMAYSLDLYRDPVAGIVGLLDYPVMEADTPTGKLEAVQYDPVSKILSFRARLGALGEGPNEVHEFTGKIGQDAIEGIFKRHSEDGALLQTQNVTLRKQPLDAGFETPYEDLAAWEREIEPVLRFRGPR